MIYGHLEKIDIILKTLSPVFIGSGQMINKKEYIFDRDQKVIHMPDLAKLAGFLSNRNLFPKYEKFLLQPRNNDLYTFLLKNGITVNDYSSFVSYSIDAGEVAYSEKFRGVLTFTKGNDGRPYIPGSSLKGVLRTAIAAQMLKEINCHNNITKIEKAAEDFRVKRRYISDETKKLEDQLFCRLEIRDPQNPQKIKWNSIQNDFMKGINISDSQPIEFENLTLCGKYDRLPNGKINALPIYRECLAPGTNVRFVMTLDKPILKKVGIDKKYIENALYSFFDSHYTSFSRHFPELREDADITAREGVNIILGGGSGYVSKTVAYPLVQNRGRAVRLVSTIMDKQFRNHNHRKDVSYYRVSPHTLKTTLYKGRYYQFGRCELIFK